MKKLIHKPSRVRFPQRGLSLVELMVALSISLLITAGVLNVFLSSKQSYRMNDALVGLQENGRFAMELLARDIRIAGFQGCADLSGIQANIVGNTSPTTNLFQTVTRGSEVTAAGWSPAAPADVVAIQGQVQAGTDVLMLQHASEDPVNVSVAMTGVDAAIRIAANAENFQANDLLLVSDCERADIFQATAVTATAGAFDLAHAATGNSSANLSKSYGTNAQVFRFVSNAYFVADTGRTNARGDAVFALFRRDIDGSVVELVEGVENMQVSYGQRLANGNVRYVPANDGTLDMSQVDTVRIGLLLHTVEAVTGQDDNQTYQVAGTAIPPAGTAGATVTHPVDERMRRVFSATIKIRNRRIST